MKLKNFRVREFRSIWDSGLVTVDPQTTCFVGNNEAGKTTLLSALYRTNPIRKSDVVFDETYDYPKREVEDYRFAIENEDREPAVVVECVYELEDGDHSAIAKVFGPKTFKGSTFTRKSYYGQAKSMAFLDCDEAVARSFLANNPGLSDELKAELASVSDWKAFSSALDEAEATEAVATLKALVAKVTESGTARSYIYLTLIWPRAPKFLYFDEYYQMEGQANLDALIEREDNEELGEGVEAMVVRIGDTTDRPGGGTFHVTWSLQRERHAKQSNDVIARLGWEPLELRMPVLLTPACWQRQSIA